MTCSMTPVVIAAVKTELKTLYLFTVRTNARKFYFTNSDEKVYEVRVGN